VGGSAAFVVAFMADQTCSHKTRSHPHKHPVKEMDAASMHRKKCCIINLAKNVQMEYLKT